MSFMFQGTQERVRNSRGVRATEVLLYILLCCLYGVKGNIRTNERRRVCAAMVPYR